MEKKFYVKNRRLAMYLYLLGFEKNNYFDSDGREKWEFNKTAELLESYEFFKKMRRITNYRNGEDLCQDQNTPHKNLKR